MFLAKYYLDVYVDLFWLNFFKNLQLSHVWATYMYFTGWFMNSLTLISIGIK